MLEQEGVPTRVDSMPSWYLYQPQTPAYREEVLAPSAVRVAVEAGSTLGWSRWVGDSGGAVGVERFGASAPWQTIFAELGISAVAVATMARSLLKKSRQESLA